MKGQKSKVKRRDEKKLRREDVETERLKKIRFLGLFDLKKVTQTFQSEEKIFIEIG